jgi:hypothetical protein
MNTNVWNDIPGVDISIPGRGESIVYREGGHEYHFEISCVSHPLRLFVESYWDGTIPASKKHLTAEERIRLVPRLVAYLGRKKEPVEVCEQAPPAAPPALTGRDVL